MGIRIRKIGQAGAWKRVRHHNGLKCDNLNLAQMKKGAYAPFFI
jgi:hypothetical protein